MKIVSLIWKEKVNKQLILNALANNALENILRLHENRYVEISSLIPWYTWYTIDTIKATEETVFRVETNGLLATDTINCEVCGQARGKRGYKIHLAACKKKALKDKVNLWKNI